ncbi:DUF7124 domain-containing protein [Halobacterium jilantaiense]|uniref:DUF7124 domain-containing protein n=1 Tax=Halobacterium jilantaiense TaxID=355548 RepID=A0A1I0QG51_9EURY|nr:hypothetical protein [Halobacterium jilantaiense]SEW25941.1 hypothetical protein SAMN04487945_2571 [Halobacterium jilantaiense]
MSQSGGSTDMTLAFELSALKELAKPGTAFAGARQWTEYVGVVSDEPTYVVTNFTRKRRIRQDFFSGPKSRKDSLESVKGQFDTERHVFVGTSDEDRALAEEVGWEYLSLEDAAENADWELAEDDEPDALPGEPDRDDWP